MNQTRLGEILGSFSTRRIAVVGDFFLDKYLLIDSELNEPSVETGLTAYQIVGKRRSPGAAGTVVNNLKALGIGTVYAVGMTGVDGEGLELRMELTRLGVEQEHFYAVEERFTPTYTKPLMLEKSDKHEIIEREINRFDIKNRKPLPSWIEYQLEKAIEEVAEKVDAIMVMDQVAERNCGVITDRIRESIAAQGRKNCPAIIYADSRNRISEYRDVLIKCNHYEVVSPFYPEFDRLTGSLKDAEPSKEQIIESGFKTAKRTGRPVFVTLGKLGQWVFDGDELRKVPAIEVSGPIDICGAGDAASSGIVAALCAGASYEEAAFIGNCAASITIKQLGCTGTATVGQISDVYRSTV